MGGGEEPRKGWGKGPGIGTDFLLLAPSFASFLRVPPPGTGHEPPGDTGEEILRQNDQESALFSEGHPGVGPTAPIHLRGRSPSPVRRPLRAVFLLLVFALGAVFF